MSKTIKLIGKHNQEFEEYMKKNGKWSFHRFSDGSIYYLAPVFNDLTRIVDTCPTPVAPVKELEQLEKATMVEDALVTINNFVEFYGCDVMLCETAIKVYGVDIVIKYSGIHSLTIDFNHDLKKLFQKIKKGHFGGIVFVDGFKISTRDLVLLEQELVYFPDDNELHTHGVYKKYSDVKSIVDIAGYYIFGRVKK